MFLPCFWYFITQIYYLDSENTRLINILTHNHYILLSHTAWIIISSIRGYHGGYCKDNYDKLFLSLYADVEWLSILIWQTCIRSFSKGPCLSFSKMGSVPVHILAPVVTWARKRCARDGSESTSQQLLTLIVIFETSKQA